MKQKSINTGISSSVVTRPENKEETTSFEKLLKECFFNSLIENSHQGWWHKFNIDEVLKLDCYMHVRVNTKIMRQLYRTGKDETVDGYRRTSMEYAS